ncbi:MAG TPA: hypothetical protein VHE80_07920 [Acidimicrobiales bacterium]|nr:hypothetical protein [Acidimicrobiales bacterium]
MRLEGLLPWVVRAAWAVLPFTVGSPLASALGERSRVVQVVASAGLWGAWAAVVAATLVPHPVSLTLLRAGAPAAVVAAVVAAAAGHGSALAVGSAAVVLALALLPEIGAHFVNGPAYPNERRFPLRVPAPLYLGVLPLAWAVAVGAPVAAVLLLAARQWVAGALVGAAAVPLGWLLWRSLHGLSRRWVVFVPAGLVLHDPMTLVDPVLFQRQVVAHLRVAEAGTHALDLTQGAPGLALELTLREEVPLLLLRPGRRGGEPVRAAGLLFTPTRPGAVLTEAASRRLPTAAGTRRK